MVFILIEVEVEVDLLSLNPLNQVNGFYINMNGAETTLSSLNPLNQVNGFYALSRVPFQNLRNGGS